MPYVAQNFLGGREFAATGTEGGPQDNGCGRSPRVLNGSANSGVLGSGGGGVDLKGTLTDVLTGRVWSFQTPVTGALAVGIGVFNISGTLATTPEQFGRGVSLDFTSVGAFGFGIIGSAFMKDADGNKIGELEVGGVTPGIASAGVNFPRTNVVQDRKSTRLNS